MSANDDIPGILRLLQMQDEKEGVEIVSVRKDKVIEAMSIWTEFAPKEVIPSASVIVVTEDDDQNLPVVTRGDWCLLFTFIQEVGGPETVFEWTLLSDVDADRFVFEQMGEHLQSIEQEARKRAVLVVLPIRRVH